MVTLLERNGDDPITLDAALSGLRGSELAVLERLLQVAGGRDAAAGSRDHDDRGDRCARRAGRGGARSCSA